MGRKPLPKARSLNVDKRNAWLKIIFPYFSKHGFPDVKMDQLSNLVGVSKATFYKHFISKEDLIQTLLKSKMDEISIAIPVLSDSQYTYQERYLKSTELSCIAIAGLSNIFLSDLKREFPLLHAELEFFRAQLLERVTAFYKEAQKDGFLRKDIDVRVLTMTEDVVYAAASDPDFLIRYNTTLEEFLVKYFHMRSLATLSNYTEETSQFFSNLKGKLGV